MAFDIWNGRALEDYLSVVAHYLDSKWILQKKKIKIISFKLIDSRHIANTIFECVLRVVEEYGICNHIISITLNNVTVDTNAIDDLQSRVSSYTEGEGGIFTISMLCMSYHQPHRK